MSKTWFVTGASAGFGRLLTDKLLAQGDKVAATARRTDAIDALEAKHGDRLWLASLDVSETDAVRRTIDGAFATMGRIDVVVSNAAMASLAPPKKGYRRRVSIAFSADAASAVVVIHGVFYRGQDFEPLLRGTASDDSVWPREPLR